MPYMTSHGISGALLGKVGSATRALFAASPMLKVLRRPLRMCLLHTGTASLRIRSRDPRGRLRGVSTSTDTPNRRSASSCNAARVKRVVVGAGSIRRSRSLPSWSSPRAAEPNTRGRVTP